MLKELMYVVFVEDNYMYFHAYIGDSYFFKSSYQECFHSQ
jgi:hypothetical protein